MTNDQLMGGAAIALALFAVYAFTRSGTGARGAQPVSTQPGQVARDNQAAQFMSQIGKQFSDLYLYGSIGNTNDFARVTPGNAYDTWLTRGSSGD